jgi:hypothetical protein
MQPDTQAGQDQAPPRGRHTRAVLAYGLGFGLFAALVSVTLLLISAIHEADFLVHGPRPMSGPGVVDFRPIRQHAYLFFVEAILPLVGITLVCIFIGAFLAARASHRFAIGMGASLIVCIVSIVLYVSASALTAQFLVGPAIGDDFLTAWALAVGIVVGLALLILTCIVGLSASTLGAFARRTLMPEAGQA